MSLILGRSDVLASGDFIRQFVTEECKWRKTYAQRLAAFLSTHALWRSGCSSRSLALEVLGKKAGSTWNAC